MGFCRAGLGRSEQGDAGREVGGHGRKQLRIVLTKLAAFVDSSALTAAFCPPPALPTRPVTSTLTAQLLARCCWHAAPVVFPTVIVSSWQTGLQGYLRAMEALRNRLMASEWELGLRPIALQM